MLNGNPFFFDCCFVVVAVVVVKVRSQLAGVETVSNLLRHVWQRLLLDNNKTS